MLQFEAIQTDCFTSLKPYFAAQRTRLSDFSVGFQFMWQKHLGLEYALEANCLILREHFEGNLYYHYPVAIDGGEESEKAAIALIEKDCRDRDVSLHFTNVPKTKLFSLITRGGQSWKVENCRRWRDYLYAAEDFKTFAGKKYAGQRNHVNKFKKLYPDWKFHRFERGDEEALIAFLKEYEGVQRSKKTFLANEEMDEVFRIVPYIGEFGLLCGYITVGEKIVACSVGERCGDTLMIHVEKGLREYESVSPCMAQEFARAFGDGVEFINRMDDAGDKGLRKSKLQYLPYEILDKYNVTPVRAIETVSRIPVLKSERLTLAPLKEKDAKTYRRLAADVERNRYWGYDWRVETKEKKPSAAWFLALAQGEFKARREMPFGLYFEGRLVGEAVLHRFGYSDEAEIGVRVLPEEEGKGFASEAVDRLAEYAFFKARARSGGGETLPRERTVGTNAPPRGHEGVRKGRNFHLLL